MSDEATSWQVKLKVKFECGRMSSCCGDMKTKEHSISVFVCPSHYFYPRELHDDVPEIRLGSEI